MRKFPVPAGHIHRLSFDSTILAHNHPGDPTHRDVLVYTPYGYDPARPLPLIMDLVGYMGTGASHTSWKPFALNLPERLDRLIGSNRMPPAIVVLPDCYTSYGGNQYINSSATGRYMDYLTHEVLPLVESRFAVLPGRNHRGVFGKSSGGYGALLHGMLRSDVWGGAVCHSGDAYFEYCYLRDFPILLRAIAPYGGSVEKFLQAIWGKEKLKSDESHALMYIGMAAHYDPDPLAPLGFQLPVDTYSGEIRWDRWEKWLAHDPVRLVERHKDALRSLKLLFIDCGTRDQYHLLWGARQLHRELNRLEIPHIYEEFEDDHSDIDYRMERSLPALVTALTPQ